MYIPHLLHTPGNPAPSPQTNPLTPRAESPPTSAQNAGFWEVQFNFWGTILAFLVAIGIITGILTWCLVCRGKRMQKKLAKAKEKEIEEEERTKREMAGTVVGEDGVRESESEVSRPLTAGSGSSGSGSLGERELEVERGMGIGMGMGTDSPVPSYHSRERNGNGLANGRGSTHTSTANVSGGNGWHKIEVDGKMYMGRERTESTFLEREIKFV